MYPKSSVIVKGRRKFKRYLNSCGVRDIVTVLEDMAKDRTDVNWNELYDQIDTRFPNMTSNSELQVHIYIYLCVWLCNDF